MRMDVRQHTENLVDWLSALHFQAPVRRAQSGLERLFVGFGQNSSAMTFEEREREAAKYYRRVNN